MVAIEDLLHRETSADLTGRREVEDALARLRSSDRELVERVAAHLPLLADLTHADTMLFVRGADGATMVGQAHPVPVPSLYTQLGRERVLAHDDAPKIFRALYEGYTRSQLGNTMIRGAPVVQEVFPVLNGKSEVVAAVKSEMLVIEHEHQRKRDIVFRRAIAHARDLIVSGRLYGGENLGRLGVYDGVMVISPAGRIEYISAPAEHLYRRLGYADNLMHTQVQELETSEYICFRAMERGVCLEQRIQEQELVWIKRVVPLAPLERSGWPWRRRRSHTPAGAMVWIQDVTEEWEKEKELRIKTAMIQEIHHRVKNNLHTIAALLRLQARRAEEPRVGDELRGSIARILSIAVVHEFLSHAESGAINIYEVGNRILTEIRNGTLDPDRPVELVLEGTRTFTLPAQHATSCALIINELVQNAMEHAFIGRGMGERGMGRIVVRLLERGESLCIEVEDDGNGLPERFDMRTDAGLGLQIVRTLVREDLRGHFDVVSRDGVKAVVSFPKWIAKVEPVA